MSLRLKGDVRIGPRREPPSSAAIASLFARFANVTFGGGSATIAVLQRELDRRGWITPDEFGLGFALARLTPGTNLLAFCTAVGWLCRGLGGAVAALLASSIPCSVVVVTATALFDVWQHVGWANAAIHGAVAAAVAVTISTSWTISKPYIREGTPLLAIAAALMSCGLNALVGLSPLTILVLAAGVGLLLPVRRE